MPLPTFPPEKEKRLIEKAKALQAEGLTLHQIGNRFGIPKEWFAQHLETEPKPQVKRVRKPK